MLTVARLAEALGPTIINVVVSPTDIDSTVRDVVVYDAHDAAVWATGDLVLGVGVADDASELLSELGAAGVSALVIKTDGDVGEKLVALAEACNVTLLAIPRAASWAHILVLMRSLLAHSEHSPNPGPTSAAPGDLQAVANMVAAMIDAPVTIEDPHSRVLAFSARQENADPARTATILGQRVPDSYRRELRNLGISRRLLSETEPIFVRAVLEGIRPRIVIALRAGDEVVGSMWAINDEPFDEARSAAFSEAAKYVAMQLLHHRLSMDIQRQHQSELLRSVLSGGTAGVSAARRLGLVGEGFRVMAVGIRDSGATQHHAPLTSCWQLMSMHLSTTHRGAAITQLGDTLYTVLPTGFDPNQSLKEALRLAEALGSRIGDELRDRLLIGIGGSIATLSEIPQSRRQADEVLRVLRKNATTTRVATIDDVRIQVVLQRLSDLESTDPLGGESQLQAIERYDAQHNTSYLETLKVYLSSFGDPTLASERLSIHTNTLRYRMRRLGELFDVDLDDGDVRLGLLLQFRLAAD